MIPISWWSIRTVWWSSCHFVSSEPFVNQGNIFDQNFSITYSATNIRSSLDWYSALSMFKWRIFSLDTWMIPNDINKSMHEDDDEEAQTRRRWRTPKHPTGTQISPVFGFSWVSGYDRWPFFSVGVFVCCEVRLFLVGIVFSGDGTLVQCTQLLITQR